MGSAADRPVAAIELSGRPLWASSDSGLEGRRPNSTESCAERESVLSTVEDVAPISPRQAQDLLGAPVLYVPEGVKGLLLGGPPSSVKHFLIKLGLALGSAGSVPGEGERFLIELASDAARGNLQARDVTPHAKGWHQEALARFLAMPERLAAIERRLQRLEHPDIV